ncbi:hypothetical protein CDA63_04535 [Hymenobacter amundsenii]|uniref:Outer membrane protein beta-barrel domain-containing protein n=1 Tax=Hymenobacter amundsenii TaxID=2006685 RepID=A0A246FNI1_9BACT|nr:hypothetical protein [Hymenobacter amundsenii]OWP64311.1 hypothetical protein CDA63_04535 [Hymenobacter amundsenii]
MKKTLFAVLLLSAGTLSAQAQISAGTKLLTGSIGYSYQKRETNSIGASRQPLEQRDKRFNFQPSAGYFIADNLVIGVGAGVNLNTYDRFYEDVTPGGIQLIVTENTIRTLRGGLFARYYKFIGEKVALYGGLASGYQNVYGSSGLYNGLGSGGSRQQGIYGSLLPGIVFFPTTKLGLELTLRGISYNRLTDKYRRNSQSIKTTDSILDFGFGLQDLNLGISLYLGRN